MVGKSAQTNAHRPQHRRRPTSGISSRPRPSARPCTIAAAESAKIDQTSRRPTRRARPRCTKQIDDLEARRRRATTPSPKQQDGRKELSAAGARRRGTERDTTLAKYHHFEFASAAFQIGIVLARRRHHRHHRARLARGRARACRARVHGDRAVRLRSDPPVARRRTELHSSRRRMLHAPAHPHEVAIEPAGVARPQHVGVLADPPLDRGDHARAPSRARASPAHRAARTRRAAAASAA